MLFPELGLDLVEAEVEGEEEEHSLALSLSSWQVLPLCIFTPPFCTLSELDMSRYVTYAIISRTTGCSSEASEVKLDKRE